MLIDRDRFLNLKRKQQLVLWKEGQVSDEVLIEWLLRYGTDDDVNWLCDTFDPLEGLPDQLN